MPSHEQDQIVRALKRLQIIANQCARRFTSDTFTVEYRLAFSAGAALPWRLMEIHHAIRESGKQRLLRRMHCFSGAESLERALQERATWKARDQAIVTTHLLRALTSIDPTPAEITGHGGLQAPEVDLQTLAATREALRLQMCLTKPERVVDLPHR